ncbi:MAG: hypothetical protein Q7T23_03665, partial [Phenylobacterium sp.]|nr:hypothetical protein [Phenylobacterium sp.]
NGNDLFIYSGGQDVIFDFKPGNDRIDVSAYVSSFEEILAVAQDTPDGVMLGGEDGSIVLTGVSLDSLSAGDFLFG